MFTAIFLNTFRLQSLLAYAEFPLTRASFQSTRTYGKVTLHCLQMRSTYNFSIKNEFHMFFLGQCRSSWPRVLLLFSCLLFAISWRMVSIGGTVHRSFTQVTTCSLIWRHNYSGLYNQFLSQSLGSLGVTVQILSLSPNPLAPTSQYFWQDRNFLMVIYLFKRKKTWSVMKELLCACWTFYFLMVFSMQIK